MGLEGIPVFVVGPEGEYGAIARQLGEGVVLEILRPVSEDPALRELILRFAVENMAEELRKELSIEPPRVVLRWEPGFEELLRERKKGRKGVSGGS